jgi:phosphoglycolate phosphatase
MDLLVFDLDGTLIDSKMDLALSVNATRAHMGMGPLDVALVSTYVGNGAPILIRRALGDQATEAQIEEALEFFLEYYREHELDHTRLYPGVQKTLDRLRDAGRQLAVLTNKPVAMSRSIVDGLGVGAHFFRVYGGNSFEFKKPHPIGMQTLLSEAGVDRARAMMVGDSSVDIQTAQNAGVRSCGVTYGFAPESLRDPAPDLLVDHMEELADWVLAGAAPRQG